MRLSHGRVHRRANGFLGRTESEQLQLPSPEVDVREDLRGGVSGAHGGGERDGRRGELVVPVSAAIEVVRHRQPELPGLGIPPFCGGVVEQSQQAMVFGSEPLFGGCLIGDGSRSDMRRANSAGSPVGRP